MEDDMELTGPLFFVLLFLCVTILYPHLNLYIEESWPMGGEDLKFRTIF